MDSIISLATAPIKAALALIRISGENALDQIKDLLKTKQKIEPRKAIFCDFLNLEKDVIDEVIFVYYKGPNSYTGEDLIEISCHGSMLIVNQILSTCIARGIRLAERGEYTARAFYHGKMDLVQAESVLALIDAKTEEQKRLSLFALKGEVSDSLVPMKDLLADLLANIEVNIDYPEYEDIEVVNTKKIEMLSKKILNEIQQLLTKAKKAQDILKGIHVVLVGKPNVGKSSLFNAFIGENKAIVTEIPGTTRDIVEGEVNLDGMLFSFKDTAGIHESEDFVESMGIKKAQEAIEEADLILFVRDRHEEMDEEEKNIQNMIENKPYLIVYNKMDLDPKKEEGICISAKNGAIEPLKEELRKRYQLQETLTPSLCSSREIGLLEEMQENLKKALEELTLLPIDLIAVYIKSAYDALKRILGETTSPDLEEEVFSRFCVGK